MGVHLVKWKPILGKNVRNEDTEFPFPELLASSSNWTILERIIHMEPKVPIKFIDAAVMAQKKFHEALDARRIGYAPGQCNWYARNFTEWISSLGYHIELTGDEFELHTVGVPTA